MTEPNWKKLYEVAKATLVSLDQSGYPMSVPAQMLVRSTLKSLEKGDKHGVPVKPLQVFGWDGFYEDPEQQHWGGYRRHICAATSIEEIYENTGIKIDPDYCSPTGNDGELRLALMEPGRVFVEGGNKPSFPRKYMPYPEYKIKKKRKTKV